MKTDLKVKFLQHLNQKKQQEEGFTLIELLVVIIIIGILAAIALPSFLNQANKAKQSEAKQYAGSMNRAQQAFFLEKGGFASEVVNLGLGIKTQTSNYIYTLIGGAKDSNGNFINGVSNNGLAQVSTLKSYLGGTATGNTAPGAAGEATTLAVLCESINTGIVTSPVSYTQDNTNGPVCPSGSYTVIK